ncbi:MAG: cytochrome family, partial [Solirubrobacteraceae bacterium]|nr:cytochrome family [Solirubrobacteraceae bacterium]
MTATALPAGPRTPAALQAARWVLRPIAFMEECAHRYGDAFTIEIGTAGKFVFLTHPDAVKEVFTGDPDVLHAGEANAILEPVVGSSSVLLLDGPRHMRHRRLMLPPLHGERMQRYGELMSKIAHDEIDSWPGDATLEVVPRMRAVTLEVIMRTVFGVREADRLDRLRSALSAMIDQTGSALRLFAVATMGPERFARQRWTGFPAAMERVDALLLDEVRRRRDEPDLADREDILSLLLSARDEDGEGLSDGELRDELVTLLVAGHETTATALSWALERLVRHPEALRRLQDEVEGGEEAYVDAVVKETLRLRPVLPIVNRRLTAPFEVAGHALPAGVN